MSLLNGHDMVTLDGDVFFANIDIPSATNMPSLRDFLIATNVSLLLSEL
jgi:hypothetical protein